MKHPLLLIAILACSLILSGCGCIMPKNDPYYKPPAAATKPTTKQVAGDYSDPWRYAHFSSRTDLRLSKDGTGTIATPMYNVIENTTTDSPMPIRWSVQPEGDILLTGTGNYGQPGSPTKDRCLMPLPAILRWSPDALYNMTTGRQLPRVGTPSFVAKFNKVQGETQTRKNIDTAVNTITGAAIIGGATGMAMQGGMNGAGMLNSGATAGMAGTNAASLGMWTALGNGTWFYNDGNLKGTVNEQGYFYGNYANGGKVSLRNPGTFTPGSGKLPY